MEKELARTTAFTLLDDLHEGVGLVTDQGRVIYLNPAARDHLQLVRSAGHLSETDATILPEAAWQVLLEHVPTSVTVAGLVIESRPRPWQGQDLILLLLNPASDHSPSETPAKEAAAEQLTALARISRELNATLLLEDILESVLDEALANTQASGGLITLLDQAGQEQLRLQEGPIVESPAADRQAMAEQISVNVRELTGDGLLRSALITPIIFEGQAAGLIHLYSRKPDYFGQQTTIFISALANHAAIAIGNARRFAELRERNTLLQQRTQQIEQFVASSRVFHSDRPLADIYEDLVYAIQEGVGYQAVLLSLAEKESDRWFLRQVTAAGLPLDRLEELQKTRQAWSTVEELLRPQYAVGGAYLVPAQEAMAGDLELAVHQIADHFPTPTGAAEGTADESRWHEDDLFFIPMRDSQGHPLGLISLTAPLDGRRPDLNTARVLEIFANQAANAIENVQLFHDMWDYALELQQLHNVSQQTLREPDFDEKLQLIVDGLRTAGWGRVSLTLRDEEYRPLHLVTGGLSPAEHDAYREKMLPAAEWRRRFEDPDFARFRRGSCYYLPHDSAETAQTKDYGLAGATTIPVEAGGWHPDDILIRPLYDREGKPVGIIGLDQPAGGRQPSERSLQTIDLYAQFAISVIENYRLFSETDRRRQEVQTLFEASRALSGSLDQDEILQAIGEHMLQAVDADAYTIYALHREQEQVTVLRNSSHMEAAELLTQGSNYDLTRLRLARQVLEHGAPVTGSLGEEQQPGSEKLPRTFTIAVLPLMIRDEMFGLVEVLTVAADAVEASALTPDQLQLLGAIINQGSIALEIAHLFEELDERVAHRTRALAEESERVKILLRITTELTTSLERDRVLHKALQLVNDVVHSQRGTILLLDEESNELMIQAAFGLEETVPAEGLASGLRRDQGLAGWVIENREATIVEDALQDERWLDSQPESDRSVLAVPLISGDDVIGVMMLTDSRPALFTAEQLSLVEAAAIQVANAIHNAGLYDLIRQQADKLRTMMRDAQVEVAKQQSILQSIADGVLVAEADGTIVMANAPTVHILDLPLPQLLGKRVDELVGLYGESGDEWAKTIDSWAHHPEALEPQTSLKNRLEIEDKIVLVHVAPVFANNDYFGTISIFRDITKEVEVDRMKSEFVSTVSHELRTPMTSIKGYADLMLMGAAGNLIGSQLQYLNVIKKNADRLQLLVNDLLDISRIETGKTQLALQPVDIPRVVNDVVNDHLRGRIQHEEKEISVSAEIAPSLPLVNADPEKITRVLTNLVDNAFNYTPAGGFIKISATANNNFVYISVHDSGIGIRKEDQHKIFDRFFRAESTEVRGVPGTGLGLAIVRSLVEMHGGHLDLESEPGEGSIFTFSLPRVTAEGNTY